MTSHQVYQFGEFQLDPAARRLQRNGQAVALEGRVLDLLLVLVERRGRTVSRPELIRALWKGAAVSDGSLRRTVSLLRKAIDARGPGATAVETVHGQGYRFAAPVRQAVLRSPPEPDEVTEGGGVRMSDRERSTPTTDGTLQHDSFEVLPTASHA